MRLRTVAQALARYLRGSAMTTQAQIVDLAAAAERSGDARPAVKACMSCGAPMPGEELLHRTLTPTLSPTLTLTLPLTLPLTLTLTLTLARACAASKPLGVSHSRLSSPQSRR